MTTTLCFALLCASHCNFPQISLSDTHLVVNKRTEPPLEGGKENQHHLNGGGKQHHPQGGGEGKTPMPEKKVGGKLDLNSVAFF